jgi:N-acetyl-1-D-myo-inositol-2-amino-2-deoxy-alpha-D-glucopyranoside deacetylase
MSILDDVRTVVIVHAHPDDETISSGGLLAELVERGTRVVLVTATRGERGEIVPGWLPGDPDDVDLVTERQRELRGALDVLGVGEHHWLGEPPARAAGLPPRRYRDSGMVWIRPGTAGPAPDADDDAFARADLEDATADLTALVRSVRPDLLVSYASDGGYGHPDHVRAHEITRRAAAVSDVPFAELTHEPAVDSEWLDLEQHRATVTAALQQHGSQLTARGDELTHSGGQRQTIDPSVGLRLRPTGPSAS